MNENIKHVNSEVEEFLRKEENQIQAFLIAKQINDAMNGKSFKVRDLCNKFKIDGRDAFQKLQTLQLFNLVRREGERNREGRYRVILTKEARILFIKEELEAWKRRGDLLQKELESLLEIKDVKHKPNKRVTTNNKKK